MSVVQLWSLRGVTLLAFQLYRSQFEWNSSEDTERSQFRRHHLGELARRLFSEGGSHDGATQSCSDVGGV